MKAAAYLQLYAANMLRPYLGSDLVAALADLQVNDLTHFCKGLEEKEEQISDCAGESWRLPSAL